MGRGWRRLQRLVRRHELARIVIIMVALWLLGAVFVWLAERGRDEPGYETYGSALWSIWIFLFSGLDSDPPQTIAGKVFVAILMVIGVGIVAMFTATVAAAIVSRRLRRYDMGRTTMNDHIVVCNWNDKGLQIIRELHAPVVRKLRPIVIIAEDTDAVVLPDREDFPEFEDVYTIKGDPTNEIILKRAGADEAFCVMVLADPSQGHLADAKSILTCMAIRSIADQPGRPHITVEGVSTDTHDHLERAGADEIVSAGELGLRVLAQSALHPGVTEVFQRLLTTSANTNEVYVAPVPTSLAGRTFTEAAERIARSHATLKPAILIGVMNGRKVELNPRNGREVKLSESDHLVLISWESPDLEEILKLS